jgi:hypothetical protein
MDTYTQERVKQHASVGLHLIRKAREARIERRDQIKELEARIERHARIRLG